MVHSASVIDIEYRYLNIKWNDVRFVVFAEPRVCVCVFFRYHFLKGVNLTKNEVQLKRKRSTPKKLMGCNFSYDSHPTGKLIERMQSHIEQ